MRFSFHTDEFSGDGVLCYYIAGYILPALVGKVAGFHAAEITELLFAAVGLLIGCLLFHRNYGEKKNYTILIVAATMFLFGHIPVPDPGHLPRMVFLGCGTGRNVAERFDHDPVLL